MRSYAGWCLSKNASNSSPGAQVACVEFEVDKRTHGTFAHIGAAADFARVLGAGGVDAPAQLEQPGGVPFGGVRDDLVEELVEAFRLGRNRQRTRWER